MIMSTGDGYPEWHCTHGTYRAETAVRMDQIQHFEHEINFLIKLVCEKKKAKRPYKHIKQQIWDLKNKLNQICNQGKENEQKRTHELKMQNERSLNHLNAIPIMNAANQLNKLALNKLAGRQFGSAPWDNSAQIGSTLKIRTPAKYDTPKVAKAEPWYQKFNKKNNR